jgi:hypothetical protein
LTPVHFIYLLFRIIDEKQIQIVARIPPFGCEQDQNRENLENV